MPHSFDRGERLRVRPDGKGVLRVHHGAAHFAALRNVIGGGGRLDVGDRRWRLVRDDAHGGWIAHGEPPASLTGRTWRADRLTIAGREYAVKPKSVKGPDGELLKTSTQKDGRRRVLLAEIVTPPRQDEDAHAIIALALTALLVGTNLSTQQTTASLNGDNMSAAMDGVNVP